jgi:hypothetical protein
MRSAGILAGNYGKAGAINLYGPAYGLPEAISGINSYWLRGCRDVTLPQSLVCCRRACPQAFSQSV